MLANDADTEADSAEVTRPAREDGVEGGGCTWKSANWRTPSLKEQ